MNRGWFANLGCGNVRTFKITNQKRNKMGGDWGWRWLQRALNDKEGRGESGL